MSTSIQFTKMHGLQNDFVVVETLRQSLTLTPSLIRELGNRKTGIGFDQLLVVSPSKEKNADFHYQIYNADGTEVEQCGNGARCVARFLLEEGLWEKNTITLHCLAGHLTLWVEGDEVCVNMGEPHFLSSHIPFLEEAPKGANPEIFYSSSQRKGHFTFNGREYECILLSMGNPHCVVPVDSLEKAPVEALGPCLNKHPQFPAGVNVGFMKLIDSHHIELRVYERGVGETLACGSGACAAVVAGRLLKQLDTPVIVHLLGGDLSIHWTMDNKGLLMKGPATTVFKGTWVSF